MFLLRQRCHHEDVSCEGFWRDHCAGIVLNEVPLQKMVGCLFCLNGAAADSMQFVLLNIHKGCAYSIISKEVCPITGHEGLEGE